MAIGDTDSSSKQFQKRERRKYSNLKKHQVTSIYWRSWKNPTKERLRDTALYILYKPTYIGWIVE